MKEGKELFVTCPGNLEELLATELKEFGIPFIRKGFRGVYVPKSIENVYLINYCSRIATRVLLPLTQFRCSGKEDLYAAAKKIDWSLYLNVKKTFAIDSNVSHKELRNSLYASLVVKDAICDFFRDQCGERPSIDTQNPDVQLNLFIHQNHASLSLDTSGAPLYKRGYRAHSVDAPLQENIAAAILRYAGYNKDEVLCDPFCGSGTFLIEAAMSATFTPSGFYRKSFGFFNLPDFKEEEWQAFKETQNKKIIPLAKDKIFGSDSDPVVIGHCKKNIEIAGFKEAITPIQKDVRNLSCQATLVVSNPPYGKRVSLLAYTYKDFGSFIEKTGAKAHILCPESFLIKETGLRIKGKLDLMNGGLDVTLFSLTR